MQLQTEPKAIFAQKNNVYMDDIPVCDDRWDVKIVKDRVTLTIELADSLAMWHFIRT